MKATGWSWIEYQTTPTYIVQTMVDLLNEEAKKRRQAEGARAARRRR